MYGTQRNGQDSRKPTTKLALTPWIQSEEEERKKNSKKTDRQVQKL
jgi:hypothetical protein